MLGATPSSFQGERFVWVHVPSVRAAAGRPTRGSGPNLEFHSARRLGIALARVIAHEVVHALAPELPHGSGLMSARLDQRMLTAPTIAIDPQVGLAVRTALAGAPPAARPADAILAVESTPQRSPTDEQPRPEDPPASCGRSSTHAARRAPRPARA